MSTKLAELLGVTDGEQVNDRASSGAERKTHSEEVPDLGVPNCKALDQEASHMEQLDFLEAVLGVLCASFRALSRTRCITSYSHSHSDAPALSIDRSKNQRRDPTLEGTWMPQILIGF